MARVINFCGKQVYQGVTGFDNFSEIFEIVDCGTLMVELRVFGLSGASPSITAVVQHTSDPTFMDNSWADHATSLIRTTTGVTGTGYINLQRYCRIKLTVANGVNATACVNGVVREP